MVISRSTAPSRMSSDGRCGKKSLPTKKHCQARAQHRGCQGVPQHAHTEQMYARLRRQHVCTCVRGNVIAP